MAKGACKCKKEECEECPEWIFTFADLVMLMMGFFVILWVIKPAGKQGSSNSTEAAAQQQAYLSAIGEIRSKFGYFPDPNSSDPVDKAMIQKALGRKEGAENDKPRETAQGTDHDVSSIRPGSQAIVGSRLMFDKGSSQLPADTIRTLDEIAEKIKGHYNIVMVKGHSALDDLIEATPQQKMDLSLKRAQVAADYLISKGVSPEMLRVQGCSTFEPVRQRAYSQSGQGDNRRVEIEVTSELINDRQDQSDTLLPPAGEKRETGVKQDIDVK